MARLWAEPGSYQARLPACRSQRFRIRHGFQRGERERFVSGHGFSRAEKIQRRKGLSPWKCAFSHRELAIGRTILTCPSSSPIG